jgi:hypothetical protein
MRLLTRGRTGHEYQREDTPHGSVLSRKVLSSCLDRPRVRADVRLQFGEHTILGTRFFLSGGTYPLLTTLHDELRTASWY